MITTGVIRVLACWNRQHLVVVVRPREVHTGATYVRKGSDRASADIVLNIHIAIAACRATRLC